MTELLLNLSHNHLVAAVLGAGFLLLAAFCIRQVYRRFRQRYLPHLEINDIKVAKPAYSSNAGYISFRVVNTRGGRAEVVGVELVMAASGPSSRNRELQPGKKNDQFDFFTRLRSDRARFKLQRGNTPTKKKILTRGEGISIRIKLESDEYYWYRFGIEMKWRNARGGKEIRTVRSRDQYIEFAAV